MKKIIILIFSILLLFILVSCSQRSANENSGSVDSLSEDSIVDLFNENASLKEQIVQLHDSIANLQKDLNSSDNLSTGDAEESYYQATIDMQKKYSDIDLLCNGAPYIPDSDKKIVIYKKENPSKKITITEPRILKMFYESLKVTRVYTAEFVLSRYGKYVYDIYYKDKIVSIVVNDDRIFSLDQYPGKYFITDNIITQLGRAFLDADDYIPVLSTIPRMYYSALLINETTGTPYFSEYNISNFVCNFIAINAKPVSQPTSKLVVNEKFVFYYYGEKIYMTIYDGYISIDDGKSQTWFAATNDDISQIISTLSVP